MSSWDTHKGTSAPITVGVFKEAFRMMEDGEYQVCSHIVHPKDEGWSICANCFQPVFVPEARVK